MNEENTNIMNEEVIDTQSVCDDNSTELINLEDEVPLYDDEPSGAELAAGVAVVIAGVIGVGVGAAKLSQKGYKKLCDWAEKPVQNREKFFQVWRPKAPKPMKEKSQNCKDADAVDDAGFKEVDSDN